tara:strand:+ start:115 stop:750 length:636 start_codon:yes stop_codon:yes gene_type:complete
MPSTIRLSLKLTEQQAAALDSVKTDLRNDSKVQALGGEVTDHTALRYILYEALDGRVYSSRTYEPEEIPLFMAHAEGSLVDSAVEVVGDGTPTHDSPEEDIIPVKVYSRPHDWIYSDDSEWDFPESQAEMHAYYEAAGWLRVAAPLEDRLLQFYWTPDGAEQGLAVFPGRDSYRRVVASQRSPDVGVAHMVPEDWDEPRTATGDIGMWSPG